MTEALERILGLCERKYFRFRIPKNLVTSWDTTLISCGVLTLSEEPIRKVLSHCCNNHFETVYWFEGRPMISCSECGAEQDVSPESLQQYDFNIEAIAPWFESVRRSLSPDDFSRLIAVFPSLVNLAASPVQPPRAKGGARVRGKRFKTIDINNLPRKCGRFSHTEDWQIIKDDEHDAAKVYEGISPGTGLEAVKTLIKAMGKNEGWVTSERNWHVSFKSHVLSRFKREQIEIGRNNTAYQRKWRIIPNGSFDTCSPIGKFYKRNKSQV